jgi:general secretion pathway protein L
MPAIRFAARSMSDRLLIRLLPDGQLMWLAQDSAGRVLSAANAGAPPPTSLARTRRVIVLVPSEQVVVLQADALSARRAQLAKAVPFALEDQLVSPVEDLHFALPEHVGSGRVTVAVVARTAMRGWIDLLAGQGIRADVMIGDALALAARDEAATLAIEPQRALLRWGPSHAVACDVAALVQWLGVVSPAALAVHDFRQAPRLELPVPVAAYHEGQTDVLAFLAAQLGPDAGPNLLQGEFAPSHRHLPAQRLWRRAAALSAAALLLLLLYAGADYLRLSRESARLEAAQREVLSTNLPDLAAVPGDPRSLMQSTLTRLRGDTTGGGVLPLLGRIGPILANTTRVRLTGLEFRNSTLELGLRAPDVAALDLVREQLANLGLNVEVTSATTGDNGVDGRLRIGAAKS